MEFLNAVAWIILIGISFYFYNKLKIIDLTYKKQLLFKIKELLRKSGYFSSYKILYGDFKHDPFAAIAVDNKTGYTAIVYFLNRDNPNALNPMYFLPNQIVSVEILENGRTITNTNRASQAAGMLIGNALLGVAGTIVGGVTGKRSTKELITSIKLKLVVEDIKNPIIIYDFFEGEIMKTSNEYKSYMEQVFHWHSKFSAIMHMTNK
jgi:hypothetical protein